MIFDEAKDLFVQQAKDKMLEIYRSFAFEPPGYENMLALTGKLNEMFESQSLPFTAVMREYTAVDLPLDIMWGEECVYAIKFSWREQV